MADRESCCFKKRWTLKSASNISSNLIDYKLGIRDCHSRNVVSFTCWHEFTRDGDFYESNEASHLDLARIFCSLACYVKLDSNVLPRSLTQLCIIFIQYHRCFPIEYFLKTGCLNSNLLLKLPFMSYQSRFIGLASLFWLFITMKF